MPKKTKYTPPPWYHDKYYITNYPIGDVDGPSRKGAKTIACAASGPSGNEFKPADADIMTAAPDMFEAIERCVYGALPYEDESGVIRIVLHDFAVLKEAFAKAKGDE
jgi:hypothetical protein